VFSEVKFVTKKRKWKRNLPTVANVQGVQAHLEISFCKSLRCLALEIVVLLGYAFTATRFKFCLYEIMAMPEWSCQYSECICMEGVAEMLILFNR
jgi:hypothetical protein